MNLALFDFDGTITTEDTFTRFVCTTTSKKRLFFGKLILCPFILLYKTRVISSSFMRKLVIRLAYAGTDAAEINDKGTQFAKDYINSVIRKEALERINWHKENNDAIVIISASLDAYLAPWCLVNDIQLFCNSLEVQRGKFTGRYIGNDCCADEKASRIQNNFDLNNYNTIYAYGDTPEDYAMLKLADIQFYQWQQINS